MLHQLQLACCLLLSSSTACVQLILAHWLAAWALLHLYMLLMSQLCVMPGW
jgi:hypothetical protein